MSEKITIALDAMGGDFGPGVIVPAALGMVKNNRNLHLILVGDQDAIAEQLHNHNAKEDGEKISVKHTTQCVAMDELPSQALRGKKDSSMRVAINLVKDGTADACVSAGNTGALMATARFVLKTLPGIDRPAIITTLPGIKGHTHMLDLGANVDSTADHLFEFAVMGSALTCAVDNIEKPTVGLLNIGAEEIKGNERVKEAARLLSQSELNYVGFVEGDDINKGEVNVIVCDGFIGNVSLKTTEGVAKMISHYMKQEFTKNIFTKPSLSKIFKGAGYETLYVTIRPKYTTTNIVSIFQDDAEYVHYLGSLTDKKYDGALCTGSQFKPDLGIKYDSFQYGFTG